MTEEELTEALEASLRAIGVDPDDAEAGQIIAAAKREYCPGSGVKPKKAGSKYVQGQIRYRCPECGKHYRTEPHGGLTKHGYKLAASKKPKAYCAECNGPVYELDYLCEKCRGS